MRPIAIDYRAGSIDSREVVFIFTARGKDSVIFVEQRVCFYGFSLIYPKRTAAENDRAFSLPSVLLALVTLREK